MRLLVSTLCLLAGTVQSEAASSSRTIGFSVLAEDAGPWPRILSSVGFQPQTAANASIFVLRPGSAGSPGWVDRVEQGATLILEGESAAAERFGFRASKQRVVVTRVVDLRRPQIPIIWQKPQEVARFEIPGTAQLFARERWSGAPLIAGYRSGAGAVLWVAANPGEQGYERFPYLLQALTDLGVQAPFRCANLWAFFDSSYRTRVDLEYFARRWRAAGIAALQVAAWHYFEPDSERDRYLRSLIDACHRNAILVYAWLELPHVSDRFWNDHPAWREKTAMLQDAHLDWRKLMNLANRDCFQAASAGIRDLTHRFDWDGLNLAEIYFESLEGVDNPARFTPMNEDVRQEFRQVHGYDPLELFRTRKDPAARRAFLDFRAGLARRIQQEWVGVVERDRSALPHLDLVLTHVDDRFDSGMRDAIGADAAAVLPMLEKHDFTFLIEDPATVWNLGPQRYPEIARRYALLTRRTDKLAIDINVVERYQNVYPTKQQTGVELFQLVHAAAGAFPRVALYFESSILPMDLPLLAAAGSAIQRVESSGAGLIMESPHGVGVPWRGPVAIDGMPWPVGDGAVVWVPAGRHTLQPAPDTPPARMLDFNGEIRSARLLSSSQLEFSYQSSSRALAVLERKPLRTELDGVDLKPEFLYAPGRYSLLLPRGQHLVTVDLE